MAGALETYYKMIRTVMINTRLGTTTNYFWVAAMGRGQREKWQFLWTCTCLAGFTIYWVIFLTNLDILAVPEDGQGYVVVYSNFGIDFGTDLEVMCSK